MRSFVLGNGQSRLHLNLQELKQYGKIYGCNALYREFEPDYLVAVDPKMIVEIEETKWQNRHQVWTNFNAKYKNFTGFNYFQPSLGWSSGPSALYLAAGHLPTEIFIFGFDYVGKAGLLNNVYADTKNYKKATDVATYHGNWEKQTEQIIKTNSTIKFYRVVEDNFYNPEWQYPNFRHINYKEFFKLMQTWPKKV